LSLLADSGRAHALDDDALARLQTVVGSLEADAPYVAGNRQDIVQGSWQTQFASFGVKHSAGKNQEHESDLALQSFNRFPKIPIKVSNLIQEIDSTTKAYNNVVTITPMDGTATATLIIHGRYLVDEADLKKFHVDFYQANICLNNGMSESDVRSAFGLSSDQPLEASIKVSKLWSDIVYVDETMRINKGSFGGLYVLTRRQEKAVSI
jgi:hypothetical protein